jgi:Tol biopolymer transport system component
VGGEVPPHNGLAWSPDGKHIAYAFGTAGKSELFSIDRDGTNKKQLTKLGGANRFPAWKPDGKQLAFVHDGKALYVANADGGGAKEIMQATAVESPAWKPTKP